MKRRCRPGIRARIINSNNAGKIVLVVKRYFGEQIGHGIWPRNVFPWVVTSLSGPLSSCFILTGQECPPAMTIVVDDCDLEPLDDDSVDSTDEQEGLPRKDMLTKSV